MTLTERMRSTREDRDLYQKEIAKILDITTQQYQLYESGQRELKLHQLEKLCIFYNISADYFLGLIDEPLKYKQGYRDKK